jgi:hypothetical protein
MSKPLPSPTEIRTSKRDLVARVATLELVIADLIHVLWRLDPKVMEKLAGQAGQDLELGDGRMALPVGDQQRDRLHTVLYTRKRMLNPKAIDA